MSDLLELVDLHSGYDGVTVLRGVTLTVEPGQIMALLGANGAGKTTTLLTISGLLPAMQGKACFLGRSIAGLSPTAVTRLGIAHVPEGRALFPSLTVSEHIRLAAHDRRAGESYILGLFPELERLLSRRASLLSGGEQQMVALARALVSRPRLLMIDEMSLGLAPIIVRRLQAAVRSVVADTGCGVLLVEQHVRLALAIADEVCVLTRGAVGLSGPSRQFTDDPAMLEAAYLEGSVSDSVRVVNQYLLFAILGLGAGINLRCVRPRFDRNVQGVRRRQLCLWCHGTLCGLHLPGDSYRTPSGSAAPESSGPD